jgi:hypothetical protein
MVGSSHARRPTPWPTEYGVSDVPSTQKSPAKPPAEVVLQRLHDSGIVVHQKQHRL